MVEPVFKIHDLLFKINNPATTTAERKKSERKLKIFSEDPIAHLSDLC